MLMIDGVAEDSGVILRRNPVRDRYCANLLKARRIRVCWRKLHTVQRIELYDRELRCVKDLYN
jgi:hypothetical protein